MQHDPMTAILEQRIPNVALRAYLASALADKTLREMTIVLDYVEQGVTAVKLDIERLSGVDEVELFHCGDEHCELGFSVRRDNIPELIVKNRRAAPFRLDMEYESLRHHECGNGVVAYDLNGNELTDQILRDAGVDELGTSDAVWMLMQNPAECTDKHHDSTNCGACHARRRADEIDIGLPAGSL